MKKVLILSALSLALVACESAPVDENAAEAAKAACTQSQSAPSTTEDAKEAAEAC